MTNLTEWFRKDTRAAAGECLTRAGLPPESAARAAERFAEATAALVQHSGEPRGEAVWCWSPGRIEVFGKHTDYCGGESILATVERGFAFVAKPLEEPVVQIINAPRQEVCEYPINPTAAARQGHWSNYPHTVVRRLARNFPQARRGATIAFASNLPPSAGMSSSSALVVGTFLVIAHFNQLENDERYRRIIPTSEELGGYLGTVENGLSFGELEGDHGVGTFGGSEDQTAILCCRPGQLVQYAYCPVRHQRAIGLAKEWVFALASSGIVAEKTGAALEKYNRVSAMVRMMVALWQQATGRTEHSLRAIVASETHATDMLRNILATTAEKPFSSAELLTRLDHFIGESDLIGRVPGAIDMASAKLFGDLAFRSHDAANRLLENQTPETNRLVELAAELGAVGASAFGAGFGGSVWALFHHANAANCMKSWAERYRIEFPHAATQSEFLLTNPGIAATAHSIQ
ncbi:MAG: hypothetical protein IT425_06750 [Pirellulales bacterium]|nr:hypothetical protein [Pirellulales bacterium]